MSRRTSPIIPRLGLGPMLLALAAQIAFLASGSVGRAVERAWVVRGAPPLERSAQIAFGDEFADFMSFIRRTVPESAKLVVPSKSQDPTFGDAGLMQYFLRPRAIVDCPPGDGLPQCIRSLTGTSTYILAVGDFPPAAEAGLRRDLVTFRGDRGVYVPRAARVLPEDEATSGDSAGGIAPVLDLLVIGGISALGILVVRAVGVRAEATLLLACALPLGLAGLTWALFLLSWAGVRLTLWTVLATGLALAAMLLRISRAHARVRSGSAAAGPDGSMAIPHGGYAGWLVYACIVAVALWISVLRSYATWDDMAAYAIRGYGIAREGSVPGSAGWGPSAATYPLNVQLGISLFHLVDGDVLPGSKLLFPFFLGAILLIAYRVWRQAGYEDVWAGTLAATLGTIPVVLDHSTTGYTNLPFSAYLALGCVLILEGMVQGDPRRQLLGSLALCGAMWTRPEGLLVVWGLIAVLCLVVKRLHGRVCLRALLPPLALVTLSWLAYGAAASVSGQLSGALTPMSAALRQGDLHLSALYWTLRYLARSMVDPRIWGLVLPAGLFFMVRALRVRDATRDLVLVGLLVSALGVGAAVFLFYYTVSFTADLRYFLGTGVERMFLPPVLMGWISLAALAAPRLSRPRSTEALHCAAQARRSPVQSIPDMDPDPSYPNLTGPTATL